MSDKFMLDTNIFNRILKENISLEHFHGRRMFATHVQQDELSRTSCPIRRAELLKVFSDVGCPMLSTETSIWGDSKWGQAKWSSRDGVYQKLLNRISELDASDGKNRSLLNRSRDARIGETATKVKLTLVTTDGNLATAAREIGCSVIGWDEFLQPTA